MTSPYCQKYFSCNSRYIHLAAFKVCN
jgi:hypothetical protein